MKSAITTSIAVLAIVVALVVGLASGVLISGSNQGSLSTTTNTRIVVSTQSVIYPVTTLVTVYTANTTQIESLQSIISIADKHTFANETFSVQVPANTRTYDLEYGRFSSYVSAGYLQITFHSNETMHLQLSGGGITEDSPSNQMNGTIRFPMSPVWIENGLPHTIYLAFLVFQLSIINDNCNSSCGNSFQVNATIDYYY
jgi:hypothetical protein